MTNNIDKSILALVDSAKKPQKIIPNKNNGVTGVTSLLDEAINPSEQPPISGAAVVDRESIKRPCYAVYDEWFCFEDNKRKQPGVYYHGEKTTKDGDTTDEYICDPLHVDAGSCDGSQNNFGLMLRFKNSRYNWRKWLMPLAMLSGSCEELRGELLTQGLRIDHHKRKHLPSYFAVSAS